MKPETNGGAGAPFVIVGAGQAAASAVQSLRKRGYGGAIVLFGDEPAPPYQRPPLSKGFLGGDPPAASLSVLPADFYARHGIELRLGRRVVAIDRGGRQIELVDGSRQPYAKLLLATGARARCLFKGLDGVHLLRSLADAERLRAACVAGARMVVVGGGYIGLEVAAKARSLGLAVTLLEAAPRILNRVASPPVAAYFDALHRDRGVDLRTGVRILAMEGRDRVTAVGLADGSTVPADLVVVGVGSVANVELARDAGLAVDDGILVDETTATADPDIFAAGDVTRFPSRLYGRRLRLESVQNAIAQARTAAAAMLGVPERYDPLPWFWSDQYDSKLQIAGLSDGHDRRNVDGDPRKGRFAVEYWRDGRLIAVDTVNHAAAHMDGRRRVEASLSAP